jgi:hypothetical protein
MKLLIMQSSPVSCHFLLGPNILLSTLFQSLCIYVLPLGVRDQVSHPYKTTGEITVLHHHHLLVVNITMSKSRLCLVPCGIPSFYSLQGQ